MFSLNLRTGHLPFQKQKRKRRRVHGVPVTDPKFRTVDVATRQEPAFVRAFEQAVDQVRREIDTEELVEAIESGNNSFIFDVIRPEERLRTAMMGRGVAPGKPSVADVIRATYNAGAQREIKALRNVPVKKQGGVGFELAFNAADPTAEALLQAQIFSLIRETSAETRLAIRDIVLQAFQTGGHPTAQAREIKKVIGLTQRQGQAVRNFRTMLESGNSDELARALTRGLRDRRFDSTIRQAIANQLRIPQSRIDSMVNRYYARSLQYRARMIARTETINAATAGQQEVWRQSVNQGLLDPATTREVWILSPEPCPICVEIESLNSGGVPLGQGFVTGAGGRISGPTAHPHCRCAVGLEFD